MEQFEGACDLLVALTEKTRRSLVSRALPLECLVSPNIRRALDSNGIKNPETRDFMSPASAHQFRAGY